MHFLRMYFKIALFWLYPCKGAHVSEYLGFHKVGEEAGMKDVCHLKVLAPWEG